MRSPTRSAVERHLPIERMRLFTSTTGARVARSSSKSEKSSVSWNWTFWVM